MKKIKIKVSTVRAVPVVWSHNMTLAVDPEGLPEAESRNSTSEIIKQ